MGEPQSASGINRSSFASNNSQGLKRGVQATFEDSLDRRNFSYTSRTKVHDKYRIVGFISSGTYGRVYQAQGRHKSSIPSSSPSELFAIKKFKPDKEGETLQYTGLSQSAIREMGLCTELSHPNLIHLVEIILEDKCVFMVFEYCEHDLLQIIHHHTQQSPRRAIPGPMIKSILFQLLNGLLYLHRNWVLHRDLKPANIMVTSSGAVRIGDLGLARLFHKPLMPLFNGDKVVVTIWYRAPDLLMGCKHYTPAVDLWAVGCIFAELLTLRPIFKGEEAKMDSKKSVPFQRNQMTKIIDVLGVPTKEEWPGIVEMPEYQQLQNLAYSRSSSTPGYSNQHARTSAKAAATKPGTPNSASQSTGQTPTNPGLESWYNTALRNNNYPNPTPSQTLNPNSPGPLGLALLTSLLTYNPHTRLTAASALEHPFFQSPATSKVDAKTNCFEGLRDEYPHRKVSREDGLGGVSGPGTKRASAMGDDGGTAAKKRG